MQMRDQPQVIHHPPNGFLHVVILVGGLPHLGREAVRRAMEEGLESSPTQRRGSPYFSGGCHSPRREGGTSTAPAEGFLTAVRCCHVLVGSLDALPRGVPALEFLTVPRPQEHRAPGEDAVCPAGEEEPDPDLCCAVGGAVSGGGDPVCQAPEEEPDPDQCCAVGGTVCWRPPRFEGTRYTARQFGCGMPYAADEVPSPGHTTRPQRVSTRRYSR